MQQDIVRLVASEEELKSKRVLLREKEDCLFLIMNHKANSMSPSFIRELHSALSEAERRQKETQ